MSAPEKLWRQLFIEQLQRRNPRLTELDFSKGGWWPSRAMMEELCQAVHFSTSLRSLNFRTVNVVGAYPCDLLCSSLAGLEHLTSLDLGSTGITGAHVLPFSLLLVFKMPALTSLSLAGNHLTEGCNDSVNVFKNILLSAAHAPRLRHLDLSRTGIAFPAERLLFWQFARQLQSQKSPLVSLFLSENSLGEDACVELATTLVQLQHLQTLQLQHCKLKGSHIVQLLSVMHQVTSLTSLHLQFNSFDGITAIPNLARNTSLVDLRLPPPPPLPDASQQANRIYMLMQHECALLLVEAVSKMCIRNRAAAAAVQAETMRLLDVRGFAESIVLEAIASVLSVFDDISKAKAAQVNLPVDSDSSQTVQVIEALNDGEWLKSKWAIAVRKKKESASASPAVESTESVKLKSGTDAKPSLPPPTAPALPALLQRLGFRASQFKSSSSPALASASSSLPPSDSILTTTSAASAARVVVQQHQSQAQSSPATSEGQRDTDATVSASSIPPVNAPLSTSASSKKGGWSKLQSKFFNKSSTSGIANPSHQSADPTSELPATMTHKSIFAAHVIDAAMKSAATSIANTQGQDTYILQGLVDRRHLNGTIVTIVPEDPPESGLSQSDSKLLQLPDGSRIRLRPRNFTLHERAPPPLPVNPLDSFGLREGEFVNADAIAKQQTQSLIKNKLTGSSRSSEAAALDDTSVKLLQDAIFAHSQSPLDENNLANFLDALARASSWAIVEASVPSYLAGAFSLPQQELQMLMEFVLAAAPQSLIEVLQVWGRSATEMPILPLACIKAAAQSYEAWSDHRPAWPGLATDQAQSAAAFFCSSTRALLALLSLDAEDSLVASHALCLYTTVICEEAAVFSERLDLLQQHSASLSAYPPPHVDAWRNDPLHAALNFIAHSLSLLCASPKSFAALRLPHPTCLCPSPSGCSNATARGEKGICNFKDLRWEQILWQLLLANVRALEICGLHRLHHKLCSDRASILSRCMSRTMQILHVTLSGFSDVCFRISSIRTLLACCLRIAWGEHYTVVTSCCDVAVQVLMFAASLFPSLSYSSVADTLQVVAALAAAEPDQSELQRAVAGNLNAASRLLHVATDSIFYRMSSDRRSSSITCEPQLGIHQHDLQKHFMSLSASLSQHPVHSLPSSTLPSCNHHGHALRVSALCCLRTLLLRHTATSFETAAALRSVYSGGGGGGGGCLILDDGSETSADGAKDFFALTRAASSACSSVCSILARHSCIYVKAAACDSILLFLVRFPLHCHVASVASLAVAPAVALLRSGNAQVLKVALQLLDHLIGHSSAESGSMWTTMVRGEDVDKLLRGLQAVHSAGVDDNASQEQQRQVVRGWKELGEHALRVHRRIHEIGGVIKRTMVDLNDLLSAGCAADEIKRAGFTARDVMGCGKSVSEMRSAGWPLSELIHAGFEAALLLAGMFSVEDLKSAGLTASQLKAAGCSATQLKSAGFSSYELRIAGFDLGSLIVAGYDKSALKSAGFVGM